jgi:RimJ/RimL family protein N-acetyltransferase
MLMHMLADAVPLYGLRIRSERLELRLAAPEELPRLGAAAAAGIHRPDERPYLGRPGQKSWVLLPPQDRARAVVLQQFEAIGNWKPDKWVLPLSVFADGEPIGVQIAYATDFALTREIATSSWLTLSAHSQGFGTEMRAAVLAFAFNSLAATTVLTRSFEDNVAACRVSEKLGYSPDGVEIAAREDGRAHLAQRFRLSATTWQAREPAQVAVSGFEAVRSWFLGPCP